MNALISNRRETHEVNAGARTLRTHVIHSIAAKQHEVNAGAPTLRTHVIHSIFLKALICDPRTSS